MSVYAYQICRVCGAPVDQPAVPTADAWVAHVLRHPPEDVARVLLDTFEDALDAGARVDEVLDAADDALNHGDDTDLRALLAVRTAPPGDAPVRCRP